MHKSASPRVYGPSQHLSDWRDELDLDPCVFVLTDPRVIALSLKRSAAGSASPLCTAMSRLLWHIAHVRKHVSKQRRARLEAAKVELRALFKDTPPRISH